MKSRWLTRRRFILACVAATPAVLAGEARWVEPTWVKVRKVRLKQGSARHRVVHFTDLHHKGDRAYLARIVRQINSLAPDFVCFTGDLIEEKEFLPEALELLAGIKSPLYGVPGNHDYWSKVSFSGIAEAFRASGGGWLLDEQRVTPDGQFAILGATCLGRRQPPMIPPRGLRSILLMHYPAWVKKFDSVKFDLLLAGHSHGGQVRLPLWGPVYVPFGVDQYDLGLFHTPVGPLYVNPGLGWFPFPIRFNCRPELTVFEF